MRKNSKKEEISTFRDSFRLDTKKSDFSEKVVKEYFEKKIDLNSKKFDNSLLKEPFFLKN